jgi:hypothetical protein
MRTALTALAVLALVACGGGDKADTAIADSLSRDLQLAQQDSTNPMADTAGTAVAPVAATTAATPKANAATPKPAATTPAPKPVAPAPAPALATGTTFTATVRDTISSRTTQSGSMMQARVATDVMSDDGRLVIPAGSIVNIRLDQFKSAPTKGGKETFSASLVSVLIDGTSYPISGKVDHLDYTLKGRGVTGGTAAKVGAGAAAGAVLGKVIGGNTTGAIVGGAVGAAGGAAVANETGDQDITVYPGAKVTMTVTEAFVAK